jgi:hypothetical protein
MIPSSVVAIPRTLGLSYCVNLTSVDEKCHAIRLSDMYSSILRIHGSHYPVGLPPKSTPHPPFAIRHVLCQPVKDQVRSYRR